MGFFYFVLAWVSSNSYLAFELVNLIIWRKKLFGLIKSCEWWLKRAWLMEVKVMSYMKMKVMSDVDGEQSEAVS